MKTTITKGAQNYIDSLVSQNKIFTVNTVINHFPNEDTKEITDYATQAIKASKYVTVMNSPVFVPSTMFATNGSSTVSVKITARSSTSAGKQVLNVPLSASVIESFKLSSRAYRFTISGKNITIHRNSSNTKLSSFSVWSNGRAMIPVPATGEYTITVK